jgi:hypothetical protein
MKGACLLLYVGALAAAGGAWTGGAAAAVRTGALVVLAAHAVEACLAFRYVRRYRGPVLVSLVLTLLFGLLHVVPLARQRARTVPSLGPRQ